MPLSRREIRTRATRFVKEFAQAHNKEADAKLNKGLMRISWCQ